jgi:hypothetical protein
VADRRRHGPRPAALVHHRAEHARQRLSSSPSNTPPPWDRARFPRISVRDNVAAQHRLVTEVFEVESLPLVLRGAGVVDGGGPDLPVGGQLPRRWCSASCRSAARRALRRTTRSSSTRCAPPTTNADFRGGWYSPNAWPTRGLRAFARIYAGWGSPRPLLLGRGVARARLYVAGGLRRLLLGGVLPARSRPEQPADHARHVVDRRRGRHPGVRLDGGGSRVHPCSGGL